MDPQELEVKYYVSDLAAVEARLRSLGAAATQPRLHEMNLRFDTPNGDLAAGYRVLRLRQDSLARLTYKGPGDLKDGVRVRTEIEFTVSDFTAARRLFESLGYTVSLFYEKYRAVYDLDGVHVTLDEMPYGNFVEVEGPNPQIIRAVSDRLGLPWAQRVVDSYTTLFERLRLRLGLPFNDLSFANFEGIPVSAEELGVGQAGEETA